MCDDIDVSEYILEIALNRWPDRPLEIVRKYPELMRSRV